MIANLKAELKKLLTIRSTYIISFIAFALVFFVSFYVLGFKNGGGDVKMPASLKLVSSVSHVAPIISVFCALLGLLLITHEYRYNLASYTLTISNSRSKVYLAKTLVLIGIFLVLALGLGALGLYLVSAGSSAAGHALPHQDINIWNYLAKVIFYCEGYGLAGFLFGALIRNQVGAIAALFIFPETFEGLLGLLLKHNTVYLPFSALRQLIQQPLPPGVKPTLGDLGYLSVIKGGEIYLIYLVAVWLIALVLFARRDAR